MGRQRMQRHWSRCSILPPGPFLGKVKSGQSLDQTADYRYLDDRQSSLAAVNAPVENTVSMR